MSDDGYGFVSPRVARLVRVDLDLEKLDAIRAGELSFTSAGSIPIRVGPMPVWPAPTNPSRRSDEPAADPVDGLW